MQEAIVGVVYENKESAGQSISDFPLLSRSECQGLDYTNLSVGKIAISHLDRKHFKMCMLLHNCHRQEVAKSSACHRRGFRFL
jgi:hypothetical protein